MNYFLAGGMLLLSLTCLSQNESGAFANVIWQGDTSFFTKTDKGVQSAGERKNGHLTLWTSRDLTTNTNWEWKIHMDFNPSSSNYARLYLISDKPLDDPALNGFYLKVGGSLDAIDLYYQEGSRHTPLISGISGFVSQEQVNVSIKVDLFQNRYWRVRADSTGNTSYVLQGEAEIPCPIQSGYQGFTFIHTSTRADKFILERMSSHPSDLSILKARNNSDTELMVILSERLPYLHPSNIMINGLIPDEAYFQNDTIIIRGSTRFIEGDNTLIISLPESDIHMSYIFFFTYTLPYASIIINEIMSIPSASMGLPDYEYIELLNRSDTPIQLFSFSFSDRQTTGIIRDSVTLAPDSLLILCPLEAVAGFKQYGSAVGIHPWPSLNNDNDDLFLKTPTGQIVFSVSYSRDWHTDKKYASGGYALEMIDSRELCLERNNWATSRAPSGGTPGMVNSQYSRIPRGQTPTVVDSYIKDNRIILIVDRNISMLPRTQALLNGVPTSIFTINQDSVIIEPHFLLLPNSIYPVTIKKLGGCDDYIEEDIFHEVIYTSSVDSLDLLFNELMYNPDSDGAEFVEIYNNSDNYLNLKNLTLIYQNKDNLNTSSYLITNSKRVLLPHSFLLLTGDSSRLASKHPNAVNDAIIQMPRFPNLNNNGARLKLAIGDKVIDDFLYNDSYHHVLFTSTKGVSLERILLSGPSNDEQLWTSAASTEFYATPGFKNSQAGIYPSEHKIISVIPEVFTPDADGVDDYALISFSPPAEGWFITIQIFDMDGRLVKRLANNVSIGASGIFTWDGRNDAGILSGIGIYILSAELFNINGRSDHIQETIVIGGRL